MPLQSDPKYFKDSFSKKIFAIKTMFSHSFRLTRDKIILISVVGDVSAGVTASILSTRSLDKPRYGQVYSYGSETAVFSYVRELHMPSVLIKICR
jgi:hypothetical protein